MAETYYELLEVSPDASADEIRSAYRAKVKETHPDVSDDPDAAERFQRVQRAREVLTDDDERARYDRLGHDAFVDGVVDPATDSGPDGSTADEPASGRPAGSAAEADGSAAEADATGATGTASADTAGSATAEQTGTADAAETDWQDSDDTRARASGDTSRQDRHAGTRTGGSAGYATRTSTSHRSYDSMRVPLTPRTAITMLTTFVLYPVFVFSSILPRFPLTVNIVLAVCTLFVIAYLISMPEIAIVVFGSWSLLAPLLLLSVQSLSLFSLVGIVALVATWFPLGLALLARSALRM